MADCIQKYTQSPTTVSKIKPTWNVFDKVKKRGTVGPLIVKGIRHEETSRMVAWSGREHWKE